MTIKRSLSLLLALLLAFATPGLMADDDDKRERRHGSHHDDDDDDDRDFYDDDDLPDEDEVEDFLEKHFPKWAEDMEWLEDHEPEEYERHMYEARVHLAEYYQVLELNPEMAKVYLDIEKLEYQSELMAGEIREKGRSKNRERKLRGLLEEIFDLKLKTTAWEIEMAEVEVNELREAITRRKKARDQIIEKRLNEMLEYDEALEW